MERKRGKIISGRESQKEKKIERVRKRERVRE
jgi:hypothetical protein